MKKIAASRNYRLTKNANNTRPIQIRRAQSETTKTKANDNQLDIDEKLHKIASKIDDLQQLTHNLAAAVHRINQWQETLPDLRVLDNVWRSLHKNTGEG